MALPSDPDYIPACTDERVLLLPQYQQLLAQNTDPYAHHSHEPALIQWLEESIH
jgi:hypothetical protein